MDISNPSAAYKESLESPIYRLSELMFGSLLAAYVLGFIGFAVTIHQLGDLWTIILQTMKYLGISSSYVCLTALMYLSYHSNILTIPSLPFKRIVYDFTLACLQGIFFGLSMVFPSIYIFLLGVNVLLAVLRQRKEHYDLVDVLYSNIPTVHAATKARETKELGKKEKKAFSKNVQKILIEVKDEEGNAYLKDTWLPYSTRIVSLTLFLIPLGLLIIILQLTSPEILDSNLFSARISTLLFLILLISLLTCVISIAYLRKKTHVLARLYEKQDNEVDEVFHKFLDELQTSSPELQKNH
ncbi:MAG: hypothetical protein ABIJ05_00625 [Patescibacteria group bacterium]